MKQVFKKRRERILELHKESAEFIRSGKCIDSPCGEELHKKINDFCVLINYRHNLDTRNPINFIVWRLKNNKRKKYVESLHNLKQTLKESCRKCD